MPTLERTVHFSQTENGLCKLETSPATNAVKRQQLCATFSRRWHSRVTTLPSPGFQTKLKQMAKVHSKLWTSYMQKIQSAMWQCQWKFVTTTQQQLSCMNFSGYVWHVTIF